MSDRRSPLPRHAGWPQAVDDVAPTVLVVGGFLTSPPLYGPFRRRLLARGAAAVLVAPIWTPDWIVAGGLGLGRIVRRAARALRAAREVSAASVRSAGAPVLIVGHSAGGVVARILTAEAPFGGHRYAAAPSIGAIVTLGTPHDVASGRLGRRAGEIATRFANEQVPGAACAPRTGYLTVCSRLVAGLPDGDGRARLAHRMYRELLPTLPEGAIRGDGVVPVPSAMLAGARQLVVDGLVHGQAGGRPWYGSEEGLDQWWAAAVEVWRAALHHRLDTRAGPAGVPGG